MYTLTRYEIRVLQHTKGVMAATGDTILSSYPNKTEDAPTVKQERIRKKFQGLSLSKSAPDATGSWVWSTSMAVAEPSTFLIGSNWALGSWELMLGIFDG
jgi:hypothetical protein